MSRLIAEYKRRSPWDGEINTDPIEVAIPKLETLNPLGISIIVDEAWGGSYEDLAEARRLTRLPILAKARKVNAVMARMIGADAVLTYGGPHRFVPSLVECHTLDEIDHALGLGALGIVLNNRSLHDGSCDTEIAHLLCRFIPDDVLCVAASGYESEDEAPERANAVLIGTALA